MQRKGYANDNINMTGSKSNKKKTRGKTKKQKTKETEKVLNSFFLPDAQTD